jgi:membrane protein implicated in regulation of membrane protease activity
MSKRLLTMFSGAWLSLASQAALAYVGPGAGLSLLGALWGLLIAVLAALVFVVLWPIRRYRRRRRRSAAAQADRGPAEDAGAEPRTPEGTEPTTR